jgi:hypothetical protein
VTPAVRRTLRRTALAMVLAIVAGVLVVIGRREFIGYDSYWHVFIARQDRWPSFWREVFDNAHPPLFYLLLRASARVFGRSLLAYRAVSIGSTVLGAWFLARIVRRTTSNRELAVVAAAAYGLSYSAVAMALEVRSYALCAAFMLAACAFYLEWLEMPPRHPRSVRTQLGFALATTGAVLSHYSTFFFIGAVLLTPPALVAIDRSWRRRLALKIRSRPLLTVLMFGLPMTVAAIAYYVHVVLWSGGRLNHVPDYMFDPTRESAAAFLWRNTINLGALFLPGSDEVAFDWRHWLSLGIIGAISVFGLTRLNRPSARLARPLLVLFGVMLGLNAVSGLADRYPFGGTPRHEFFLVAFAVASFFSLFELARRATFRTVGRPSVQIAAATCAVIASVAFWSSSFRVIDEPLFQSQMNRFRRAVASPQAVLVAQFTFINFFMHHHEWDWHLVREWNNAPVRQLWSLSRGSDHMQLCRGTEWSLDMSSAVAYSTAAECLEKSGASRVALFQTQWNLERPLWDTSKTSELVQGLSESVDLKPTAFESDGGDVFAEFALLENLKALNACSGPPTPPSDLHVVSNSGHVVVLSWKEALGGRPSYLLEAGRRPGLSDVLTANLGRTTTFTATDVRPATYYARVRGKNSCGTGGVSNEIVVVVN